MPDHGHSFCAPDVSAVSLSQFIGGVETLDESANFHLPQTASAATGPIWQREFSDHVLRSEEGYDQKWNYVRDNPVRAGFVLNASEWSFAGEIDELRL
jgi:REP-associated tyrosine transposase